MARTLIHPVNGNVVTPSVNGSGNKAAPGHHIETGRVPQLAGLSVAPPPYSKREILATLILHASVKIKKTMVKQHFVYIIGFYLFLHSSKLLRVLMLLDSAPPT